MPPEKRGLGALLEELADSDTIVVSEISRLGRSMLEVMGIFNRLVEAGVRLGRPRGPGRSKLDPHRERIEELLGYAVPKAKTARQIGVAETRLHRYCAIRRIGSLL